MGREGEKSTSEVRELTNRLKDRTCISGVSISLFPAHHSIDLMVRVQKVHHQPPRGCLSPLDLHRLRIKSPRFSECTDGPHVDQKMIVVSSQKITRLAVLNTARRVIPHATGKAMATAHPIISPNMISLTLGSMTRLCKMWNRVRAKTSCFNGRKKKRLSMP